MAQLNDTMVQGDLRVTGTMYGNLSGNASTATKWATGRTFKIQDSDGTNTGTSVTGVNGSGDVTIKLPSTIKATLTGTADTAKATSNSTGSGANQYTVNADTSVIRIYQGQTSNANYYGIMATPTQLTIGKGINNAGSILKADSTSLSGTLTVSGATACNGGLGVSSGFTVSSSSGSPLVTISSTDGAIATTGLISATAGMSAAGEVKATAGLTAKLFINLTNSSNQLKISLDGSTGNLAATGSIAATGSVSSTTGLYSNGGAIYVLSGSDIKANMSSDGTISCTGGFIGEGALCSNFITVTNYNDLTKTGFYRTTNSNGTNAPEGGRVGIIVMNTDGFIVQLALGGKLYARKRQTGGAWSSWVTIVNLG